MALHQVAPPVYALCQGQAARLLAELLLQKTVLFVKMRKGCSKQVQPESVHCWNWLPFFQQVQHESVRCWS